MKFVHSITGNGNAPTFRKRRWMPLSVRKCGAITLEAAGILSNLGLSLTPPSSLVYMKYTFAGNGISISSVKILFANWLDK
jgi:hypothetical protein